VTGDSVIVRNPATLENIAELTVATANEVKQAVARARKAQAIWSRTSLAERSRLFYRLRDLLLDDADKLADILTAETGRPRAEVYGNEIFYFCNAIGLWAKKGAIFLKPEKFVRIFLCSK
jgi:acyl-CoA reductase-like NAD-dependent aldehyde dehydrogenase